MPVATPPYLAVLDQIIAEIIASAAGEIDRTEVLSECSARCAGQGLAARHHQRKDGGAHGTDE